MRDYRNAGKGWYVVPDSDTRRPSLDRDAAKAQRPPPRPLVKSKVVAGNQTYTAYDAHALLEIESERRMARPGHPIG